MNDQLPERRSARSTRRWLRFSLRTLFLITTIFGVWLAYKVHTARQQREAVALYLRLGGTVRYDYEVDQMGRPIRNARPPEWPWLRTLVGGEYLDSVVALFLSNKQVSDADVRQLAGLPHLKDLWLGDTQITDDAIDSINQLRMLRQLELSSTGITDAGLMRLGQLPHLTYLQLDGTAVTDRGVESLLRLPRLYEVKLTGTRVTEQGVRRLLDAGKQVHCALDPRIIALDASGKPTSVVTAGQQVPLRGTFSVPTGARPGPGPAIIMIVGKHAERGGQRVVYQSGTTNYVQTGPTTYECNTILHLPPSLKTALPGELEVRGVRATICVEPLQELRPAVETEEVSKQ